ncbi:MAG: hypothetical protein ACC683_10330 [Acidimicrobiia bacterium]
MTTSNLTQIVITEKQQRFASWMTDVLVYIVVLNLFVEFSDAIVIDSFWISILTAVLLKGFLDVVVGLERRVGEFFGRRDGTLAKVLGLGSQFLILFISKLVILEIVDLVFRERVQLGHFVDVLVLIVAMMAARRIIDRVYMRLGEPASES